MTDPDREMLAKIVEQQQFVEAVLKDELDDWGLAKDLGEFLVRIAPDEVIGHAILARAFRHLGDPSRAGEELRYCQDQAAQGNLVVAEKEVIMPFLAVEEEILSGRQ